MIWMGRVPNQKHIVVSKAPCDVAHIYTMRNKESEAYASRTLGNAAYRMWTYLSSHQDGYGFDLSSAAVEKEYGIKIRQYNTGVAELIEKGFLKLLDDNNNYSFVEYPVITKCNNEENREDGSVITKCNNVNETNDENKDKNPVITKRNNDVITKCDKGVITKCDNRLLQNVIRNNTNNTYNTIDNTEFSPHDNSTKVDYHFEENLSHEESVITKCNNETCDTGATGFVYTSRIDGKNDNMDNFVHMDNSVQVGSSSAYVLSKDELRLIHTSDGAVVELPIRNILDGLKDALTNQKNEKVLREISEKCDLTDKQREEIDNTIELWRLGFQKDEM